MASVQEAIVHGRAVRYLEAGSGQPMVLIHAFPFNADMWRPQLDRVPAGWRFIAPDLHGFGGGDLPPGTTLTMDDYAGDVLAMMDVLGLDRAVIGGLSMGGYVAFALNRLAPDRINGLLLADTRAEVDTPEGLKGRKAMLERLRANGVAAVAEDLIPKLLGESSRRLRLHLVGGLRRIVAQNGVETIAAGIGALMARVDSTADLPGIRVPTLIVVGAEDTITPPIHAQDLHRGIPGSQLVMLESVGHLSNLENPDAFSAALQTFLSNLRD